MVEQSVVSHTANSGHPSRVFPVSVAKRAKVPLLVGLFGPSGSGKTYSALRLATGITSVAGGDIYVIDTEANRALHYADTFKFQHVPFSEPFGSLDYLAVLRQCVCAGCDHLKEENGPTGSRRARSV